MFAERETGFKHRVIVKMARSEFIETFDEFGHYLRDQLFDGAIHFGGDIELSDTGGSLEAIVDSAPTAPAGATAGTSYETPKIEGQLVTETVAGKG